MNFPTEEMQNNPYIERQSHRRLARKRRVGLVGLLWVTLGIYLVSPLSQVRTVLTKGNRLYTQTEIISISGLEAHDVIWWINPEIAREKLSQYPFFDDVRVYLEWGRLVFELHEIQIIARICTNCDESDSISSFEYLLSNGQLITSPFSFYENSLIQRVSNQYRIPLVSALEGSNIALIEALSNVPYEIRSHIISIENAEMTPSIEGDYSLLIVDERLNPTYFHLVIDAELIPSLFTSTKYEKLIGYIKEDALDPTNGLICGAQIDQEGVICSSLQVIS